MKEKIVVCDDDPGRAAAWAELLAKLSTVGNAYQIVSLAGNQLGDAVAELEDRRRLARQGRHASTGKRDAPSGPVADIDQAAILVVDYDLIDLQTTAEAEQSVAGPSETGERVAYLARCYSHCATIVALNQFVSEPTFNLRLHGHVNSYADLNVSGADLTRPTLWTDDASGYRPWSWPCLLNAPKRHRSRVAKAKAQLNQPILTALGLYDPEKPSPAFEAMRREHLEFLSGSAQPEETTFADFVTESGNGLRGRDRLWEPDAATRIAAARIHKWLERIVLPGQDILVDAPHLALRYPSLLAGKVDDLSTWAATTRRCGDDPSPGLDNEALREAAFPAPEWLSRPAWLWPLLLDDQRVAEVRNPWDVSALPWNFCEDISEFRKPEESREFSAEVLGPFTRRFVAELDDIRYEPAVRFAL